MKDFFGDCRCSNAVIQFLRSTEVGRRFRERGLEEDDRGYLTWGCGISSVVWNKKVMVFWKLCMCLDCIVFLFLDCVFICFYIFL
jgi:hypothetical protein